MSHEFESGFFTRKPAWHGLGEVLEQAPTVEEGIRKAGLDWKVVERPIYIHPTIAFEDDDASGGNVLGTIGTSEWKAIMRETDLSLLGIVKKGWTPLQNESAFTFFNPFLAEGDATLEAAGSLKGGKVVWVLAKLSNGGGTGTVIADDEIENYLLLCNSHDGSMAVWVQFTAVRVVCWNTLSLAITLGQQSGAAVVKVRHTGNVEAGLREVQAAIDLSRKSFRFTLDVYKRMAEYKFSLAGFKKYVQAIFMAPHRVEEKPDSLPLCFDDLERLWRTGAGTEIPGVKDTLWGAFNAVSEWTTHERGRSDETRLRSTWFGQSAVDGRKALVEAGKLVGVEL